MGGIIRRNDPWALATYCVWVVIMVLGLFPEWTFSTLREAGAVLGQRALVNHPMAVTLAFAGFMSIFTWMRCREAQATIKRSQASAIQVGLLAFLAFLPIRGQDIFLALSSADAALRLQLMAIIWTLGIAKLGAWIYLLSMLFRYYVVHNYRVFADMASVIPSARREPRTRYGDGPTVYDPSGD